MGKPRERSVDPGKKGRGTRRATSSRHGLLPMTSEDLLRTKPVRVEPFAPRTEAQARYAASIASQTLTFGVGPAGTGKTYVVATIAAEALLAREIERIVITRPICEAGEKLGFLPGDMKEKTDLYMAPLVDVLNRRLGRSHVEALLKAERIQVLPLAFMRGYSLRDAYVILDEAQNTTPGQMKMFLTRMEDTAKVIVDGDLSQRDIPGPSGLADALDRLTGKPGVGVVRFTRADIVRSGFVQMVVDAYSNEVEDDEAYEGLQRALAL